MADIVTISQGNEQRTKLHAMKLYNCNHRLGLGSYLELHHGDATPGKYSKRGVNDTLVS